MALRAPPSPVAVVPFARLLRQLRVDAGLTQAALAEQAGLSGRGIQRLEGGLGQPYPDTTRRLADTLRLEGEARAEFERAAKPARREPRARARPSGPGLTLSRHSLPVSLTSFIGREQEVQDIRRRLGSTRLLTLIGPGGVGKTRLAVEVVSSGGQEPKGMAWVGLAALTNPRLVSHAVAAVFGIPEEPKRGMLEVLVDALQVGPPLLLVLDNCEHLIVACAELLERLLTACPQLHVLATSREPLRLAGEIIWRVSPLPAGAATSLFVARASTARPDVELPESQRATVAQLCGRLDGLPLAIELAAACVNFLAVEEIAARLDQRFSLLDRGSRTAPARHQTLQAMVDWSYELLSPEEQRLFRCISLFAGGWTAEALEAIWGAAGGLRVLRGLVDKSLVVADEQQGETRYRMLETLRQYSAEKLREAGEERGVRSRHLAWFLAFVEHGELATWGAQQQWVAQLEHELDNIRAALTWSRLETRERNAGLRLASALAQFWFHRGYVNEGCEWLATLLAGAPPNSHRVKALLVIAFLRIRQADLAAARPRVEEALLLARQLGNRSLLAWALWELGDVRLQQGDPAGAQAPLTEGLALARELDGWPRAYSLLRVLGEVMEELGQLDQALAFYQEGLQLARLHQREEPFFTGLLLRSLGSLQLDLGQLAAARESLKESVKWSSSDVSFAHFAGLAVAEGDLVKAFRLAGAAVGLRRVFKSRLLPFDLARLERRLKPAYSAVDPATREAAWAEGAAMSYTQAVEHALVRTTAGPRPPLEVLERPGGLTPREWEVVQLIARGYTNKQIAASLVISERTAARHVENILAKLNLTSRAHVALWAGERGGAQLSGPTFS